MLMYPAIRKLSGLPYSIRYEGPGNGSALRKTGQTSYSTISVLQRLVDHSNSSGGQQTPEVNNYPINPESREFAAFEVGVLRLVPDEFRAKVEVLFQTIRGFRGFNKLTVN
jgi:hypothetical protein